MFTEGSLRQYPALVKALTGVPAEAFWPLVAQAAAAETAARARRLRQKSGTELVTKVSLW